LVDVDFVNVNATGNLRARCMDMSKSGIAAVRPGAFAMEACVVGNVVSAHASLPCLAKVLQFTTGVHANCMLSAVHGPRWSVSDIWWDLGPTT